MATNRPAAALVALAAAALLVGGLWGRLFAPGEGMLHARMNGGAAPVAHR